MLRRFRVSSLLWVTAIVAAFFAGQQSHEILQRLAHVWQSMTGGAASYRVTNQPDGSILISCDLPVPQVLSSDSSVCFVEPIDAQRIRVKPRSEGVATINIWMGDGTAPPVLLTCFVKDGNFTHSAW